MIFSFSINIKLNDIATLSTFKILVIAKHKIGFRFHYYLSFMLTAKCYHELCFQLVVESKPLSDLLIIIALRFKVISILLLRIYDNSVRKH